MIKWMLFVFFFVVGFGVFVGCFSFIVIIFNDGCEIQVVDIFFYDEDFGFYEFEQFDGKCVCVNKDQVCIVKEF